jgi:hypothetical protein
MSNDNLIWYVGYGSNLNLQRFNCYLFGGIPNYSFRNHKGSGIRHAPVKSAAIKIPFELYFSKSAESWENKGVAFLKSLKNNRAETLCAAYLIQKEQFIDVLLQENGKDPKQENISINFNELKNAGEYFLPPENENQWYGRILYLGEKDGYGLLTFTAKWDDAEIQCTQPGENYLKTIIEGIKTNFELSTDEIINYLFRLCGIHNKLSLSELERLIHSS